MPRLPKVDITKNLQASLQSGIKSEFRLAEKYVIEQNIKEIEREILDNDELGEKEREDLRTWRQFLTWFISLPEQAIQSMESGETDPIDFDPFPRIRQRIKNVET